MSNSNNQLKILGIFSDYDACGYYRILYPLAMAHKRKLKDGRELFCMAYNSVPINVLDEFDVIIVQRACKKNIAEVLEQLHKKNKRILFELDDNLHNIHLSNPSFKYYSNKEKVIVQDVMQFCDAITTTVPEIGLFYSPWNPHTYVLPNLIDFDIRKWPIPKHQTNEFKYKKDDELIIGWSGSTSHIPDLDFMESVVKVLLKKYSNIKIALNCFNEFYKMIVHKYNFDTDKVINFDFVHFNKYPQTLVKFDIAIIPLIDTLFNRCKSNLKVIEFGACGVPSVASNVMPYKREIKNGFNGFIANNSDEFIKYISLLIENPDLRYMLSTNVYNKVKEDYDLYTKVDKNIAAWTGELQPTNFGQYKSQKAEKNNPCPCGSGIKAKKCCYMGVT